MYEIWLGEAMLPIAPEKIKASYSNQNKTINLINNGEVNLLKLPRLTDISFNFLLPAVKYNFAKHEDFADVNADKGFIRQSFYLAELEKLKVRREPFTFKILRTMPNGEFLFDTEMAVSLEEYEVVDDKKNGFDIEVSIKLKQYKEFRAKVYEVVDDEIVRKKEIREQSKSPEPKSEKKSYTVIKNDTLWAIAKKFYGDGSKYMSIAKANNIPNPNSIRVGQVLTIPIIKKGWLSILQVFIENNNNVYEVLIEDGATWQTERQGSPGVFKFSVIKDGVVNFTEGNKVTAYKDEKEVFFGFVFSKKRNKGDTIEVTAYDQIRYLKNKDTMNIENMRADEIVSKIAKAYKLNVGVLANTSYKIASQIESDTTLIDIIQTALDTTLQNKKEMYVLYDDFGKLALSNISEMKIDVLIDSETAENFNYTSSIDENTFNQVKLIYENKKSGKRDVYLVKDTKNINSWGILQHTGKLEENENGKAKAEALLQLYNRKTRKLSIDNCIGDIRVRGGSMVVINLALGDIEIQSYMLVEKARHIFKNDEHFMNLTVRGGDFIAWL